MDQSKVDQVVRSIRQMIHGGVLREGDALPSTRALAAELGVSRGTVVAAFEQLDGEGYLRTRHGAVARVAAAVEMRTTADAASSDAAPGSATASAGTAGTASTGAAGTASATSAAGTAGSPVIDATPGIPAVAAISPRDWRAAWRAAAELPLQNRASDAAGTAPLREQIVAQLGLSRGFTPTVDRVVITAGTSDAISLVTEALRTSTGRAPRIAVEDPGYPGGRAAVVSAGGHVVPIPVAADGIDLVALRAAGRLDAVMVTPTHQYPLGSTMPVARRRELLEWAARTGTVIVEDDYDSEFRHRGSPVPALAALDTEGVVVHLGGFSKILDPRLRCAYLVEPAGPLAAALDGARVARGPAVAEPVQAAVAHLLRTGALRRHLGRVRRDYTHKRERIVARLAEASVPGLEAHALNGGLHVVLTWPRPAPPAPPARTQGSPANPSARPLDSTKTPELGTGGRGTRPGPGTGPTAAAAEVVERLAARGIRISDLSAYRVTRRPADAEGVVIGYAAVSPAELDRVFDALFAELA